ncbi:glycosyltransferase family 4 protein [Saccharomonospora azurea]|uniref:glycosyltransferase family 4 protein n=1 Tax=Saccharomonospora azurea TaxID=40988 RepID=UPI003D89CD11
MSELFQVCLAASSVPPAVGGVEVFLGTHARLLAERGIVVHLLCGNQPTASLRDVVERSGGTVEVVQDRAPADAMPWEYYTFQRAERLFDLLDRTGCQVVHAASHDVALAGAIAKRARPGTTLVTAFGEMATETGEFGVGRTRFICELREIDLFVAWSRYYQSKFREHGVHDSRVRLVYAGVETELFGRGERDRGRDRLGIADDRFVICCPSRFSARKGQRDLVAAIAAAAADLPAFHVVFTGSVHSGSVEYLNAVKQDVAAAGLDPRVTFALDVDFAELPDILAAADLVVQPSHREGLGGAALEAMSAGRCVLLTRTTGFDEIAEPDRTAAFTDPASPDTMAADIIRLARDPERRAEIGARAASHAKEYFDAGLATDGLIEVYREARSLASRRA